METRRTFLKKAGLLSGMTGMNSLIPASIRQALAIDPTPGTSWEDAEHIVILMQENRSFDHCFGMLRGVRGFNDPRAIQLPDGNPVWLQSDAAGQTYAPFHLDMKDTRATWMNSLPHSWKNQVNARNDGRYDQWLNEKRSGIKAYAEMPLTLGFYDRQDIPFYYALADAFTVCDQHFCSALTGTDPNRLYFWTGTIRAEQNEESLANVWNEDMDYEKVNWKTFPEVLEENEITWKFYQNAISLDTGFKTEEEYAWLSNFQDNPLEFFSQYNVLQNINPEYHQHLIDTLPGKINALQQKMAALPLSDPEKENLHKGIEAMQGQLNEMTKELKKYDPEKYGRLSSREKSIHQKAFVTNSNDPDYLSLETVTYTDNGTERNVNLPKGDLLHQFRQDVETGKLPAVSWLAAPENLSDHPASAWYGAWYVSEVMDILTKNPETWKKTIFILTYDENDGYFDHVPPFVPPHSGKKETGAVSGDMDTRSEWVTSVQQKKRNGYPYAYERESPIGLGFRVPLIVASPWSRGGFVNSEVFDHTSTLQFLETFLSRKTGRGVKSSNISDWRRTVCGNLTSVFRDSGNDETDHLRFVDKKPFLESVYNAKFKKIPSDYKALTSDEIQAFKINPDASPFFPVQEKGIRPSSGLAYQLYADGQLNEAKNAVDIRFQASHEFFGQMAKGSPFHVYVPGKYDEEGNGLDKTKACRAWAFTVKPADHLLYSWPLKNFENGTYLLRVYGPNGFFREFSGSGDDPLIDVRCEYQRIASDKLRPTGHIELILSNHTGNAIHITVTDNAYKTAPSVNMLDGDHKGSNKLIIPLDLSRQHGWYDFTVKFEGHPVFWKRYAGRVETGKSGFSDPLMGGMMQA
jgi:phospholipase C